MLDVDSYGRAVAAELEAMGFCADPRVRGQISVRTPLDQSETYGIISDRDHVRRGLKAYEQTCRPASFPIDPEQWIDKVRVGFFRIECADGRRFRNGDRLLPMGCLGHVTATPKDVNNNDVPGDIHGPEVDWTTTPNASQVVTIDDVPGQPFNKLVAPRQPGKFGFCATVKGVQGCFEATVIR